MVGLDLIFIIMAWYHICLQSRLNLRHLWNWRLVTSTESYKIPYDILNAPLSYSMLPNALKNPLLPQQHFRLGQIWQYHHLSNKPRPLLIEQTTQLMIIVNSAGNNKESCLIHLITVTVHLCALLYCCCTIYSSFCCFYFILIHNFWHNTSFWNLRTPLGPGKAPTRTSAWIPG